MSLKKLKVKRYKVVKKNTRCSCIINGNSKYGLKYLPGQETHALPETLGIMTFRSKDAALMWAVGIYTLDNFKVIEVIPMGKGTVPIFVANSKRIDMFYENRKKYLKRHLRPYLLPPDGTICYPAVYVVD